MLIDNPEKTEVGAGLRTGAALLCGTLIVCSLASGQSATKAVMAPPVPLGLSSKVRALEAKNALEMLND